MAIDSGFGVRGANALHSRNNSERMAVAIASMNVLGSWCEQVKTGYPDDGLWATTPVCCIDLQKGPSDG